MAFLVSPERTNESARLRVMLATESGSSNPGASVTSA
jgi:hypothetical protein